MFKKLLMVTVAALSCSSFIFAQDFSLDANPVEKTTSGSEIHQPSDGNSYDAIAIENYINNINTADTITITWTNITDTTQNPAGWALVGVCDNIICRAPYDTWYYGTPQQTAPIAPNDKSLLEARVYAPVSSPDGSIGVYKVEVKTANQTDTAVFILTKNTTGISAISLDDNRVSIYPNPVTTTGNNLNVFINKDLKAAKAVIYNIIGREQMSFPVASDKEVNTYNVSSLAPGIYMLRLTDAYGKVITSRKFSKH